MTIHVSDAVLSIVLQMRSGGRGWDDIGRHVGFSRHVLRAHLDPEYVVKARDRYALRDRFRERERRRATVPHQVDPGHMPAALVAELVATVPRDTRGRTARLMGDPLPGRSALDRKDHSAFPPQSTLVHNPYRVEAKDGLEGTGNVARSGSRQLADFHRRRTGIAV